MKPSYKYFKSQNKAKVGDVIATCRNGHCEVIKKSEGMLIVKNLSTNETFSEYPSDCDFLGIKA
jgi:hypothetical protein